MAAPLVQRWQQKGGEQIISQVELCVEVRILCDSFARHFNSADLMCPTAAWIERMPSDPTRPSCHPEDVRSKQLT